MDTGIHLPPALDPHRTDRTTSDTGAVHANDDEPVTGVQCDLLDAAHTALKNLQQQWPEHFTNATALRESAQKLHKDALSQLRDKCHQVKCGTMTLPDLETDLAALVQRQESVWDTLVSAADRERHRVMDDLYGPVQIAESDILHGLHDGVPCLLKTQVIRRSYRLHLKRDFRDAHSLVDELCGFPHGILVQVELLRDQTLQQIRDGLDRLRRREASASRLRRLLHAPNWLHHPTTKVVGPHP